MIENLVSADSNPYPGCPHAIAWFECVVEAAPTDWVSYFQAGTVDDLIKALQAASPKFRGNHSEADRALIRAAYAEYDTPDFRRYLMARVFGGM